MVKCNICKGNTLPEKIGVCCGWRHLKGVKNQEKGIWNPAKRYAWAELAHGFCDKDDIGPFEQR